MSDSRELKKVISKKNKVLKGSVFLTNDLNKKKDRESYMYDNMSENLAYIADTHELNTRDIILHDNTSEELLDIIKEFIIFRYKSKEYFKYLNLSKEFLKKFRTNYINNPPLNLSENTLHKKHMGIISESFLKKNKWFFE